MTRLPIPGGDKDNWGGILNEFLLSTHEADGTLKDGMVTEAKLDAATRSKLNSASTGNGTGTIADGSISTAKLQDGAVTNAKIAVGASIDQSKVTNLTTDLAGKASIAHTHSTSQISDSTTTGRNVLTATDAGAARAIIGAGTSNLTLGATAGTAAAGNHTHSATDILSGTLNTARLGTGTASNTTYLRGDGTWAVLSGSGGGVPSTYALGRVKFESGWPSSRPVGYAFIDWIKSSPSDPDPNSDILIAGDTITDWS